MPDRKSAQQVVADAVVRAAKERQRLVAVAERATIAPESLSYAEIKAIGQFVVAHGECWQAPDAA